MLSLYTYVCMVRVQGVVMEDNISSNMQKRASLKLDHIGHVPNLEPATGQKHARH